jgi:hypothetical protein
VVGRTLAVVAKPTTWTCNACEHEGKTSKEHLIHIAIGRVILANRGMSPDEVRRHLRSGPFRDFRYIESIDDDFDSLDVAWLNQEIRGLICETCNQRWARQLEQEAGNNLYDFTHGRGKVNGPLLRRWAWYFAIKLWFAGTRPEGISHGPLLPVLRALADPDVMVKMPVLVARVQASPRDWSFAATGKGWRGEHTPFIAWIIRGVVWVVTASGGPTVMLPIPATPLVSDLRLQDVKTIRQRQLVPLITATGVELVPPTSDIPG